MNYDYLFNSKQEQEPVKQEKELIPKGLYQVVISDIKVVTNKQGKEILITTFRIISQGAYLFKTFDYIRTIPAPEEIGTKKGKFLLNLFREYVDKLGIKNLDNLAPFHGKEYTISLDYSSKGFYNIKVVGN